MAINDLVPGMQVIIGVNQVQVQEYDDPAAMATGPHADKTVIRYIESISDTTCDRPDRGHGR